MQPPKDKYFPPLTGIRAVAAYLVFFHHYNPFERLGEGNFLRNLVNEWHVGVAVFFVLSGFLIAYRYYDRFSSSFRTYILNRFARIYPVYFLLTTLTFLFGSIYSTENVWVVYISNITLLKGLFQDFNFTGIQQGWSLTVEELFYFSAPFFFFLIRRNKLWLWFIPVLLLCVGTALVWACGGEGIFGFFKTFRFMLLYTYFGRCIEFFVGIFIAIYIRRWNPTHRFPWLTYGGIFAMLVSVSALALLKGDGKYGLYHPFGIAINNIIFPCAGVAVFFCGLLLENSMLRSFLGSKPMVLLGKSSYVFYLIHMGFMADWLTLLHINSAGKFVILNMVSILIFKWLEEPLNHVIKKLAAA